MPETSALDDLEQLGISRLLVEAAMNSYEIDHTLREVERAIELSSGRGFQQTIHQAMPLLKIGGRRFRIR